MLKGLYPCFSHWGEKNAVWIVSDTHFGEHLPGRPSDEELITVINRCVGKNGYLIHLGDVGDITCASQLKGYKILICGNHDLGYSRYSDIFDEVYTGPLMISEKIILSHEPIRYIDWAFNIHGHVHSAERKGDRNHLNCCLDATDYKPVNFDQLLKSGLTSKIKTLHRQIIDTATLAKRPIVKCKKI